jgi:Stage II sporulation protein M
VTALIAERRRAMTVAGALFAFTVTVALAVRLKFAAEARRALDFPFAGVAPRLDTVLSIFANNARLLTAVFAALAITQSPWVAVAPAFRGAPGCVLLAAADTVLALSVALNTLVVGTALGAYGGRMVAAMLPHGPVELASYALALALYLRARRQRVATRHIAAVGTACTAGLALAAVLETFVSV